MNAAETAISVKGPLTDLAAGSHTGTAADAAAQTAGRALGDAANAIGQNGSLVSWAGYFQALAVLFLIVALLAFFLWLLKRKGGIKLLTQQGGLTFESRLSLGPKKSLIVVRFLNKRVLLGVTDQQITMLTELPNDENDVPAPQNTANFNEFLNKAEPPQT